MQRKPKPNAYGAHAAERIAWLAFVVPLILTALLLVASTGHAAPTGPVVAPLSFEEELEAEGEGEEEWEGESEAEEECAEAEEEFEAGELSKPELDEYCAAEEKRSPKGDGVLPEECILRSFRPQAVANPSLDKLKLTIGYTTYESADATTEIRKGNVRIGSARRHLGRSGVLRFVESVGADRVPKRVAVRIQVPGSPRACAKLQTKTIPVSRPAR